MRGLQVGGGAKEEGGLRGLKDGGAHKAHLDFLTVLFRIPGVPGATSATQCACLATAYLI